MPDLAFMLFLKYGIFNSRQRQKTIVLSPTKDSYTNQNSPTTNYGTSTEIATNIEDYGRAYIGFNIDIPAGSTIVSATLQLYRITGSAGQGQARRVIEDWEELTVVHNNRPNYTITGQSPSVALPGEGFYEFDIADIVNAWVNDGAANYGVLIAELADSSSYKSKEDSTSTRRPKLTIVYQ
jgi:hypothetical protein